MIQCHREITERKLDIDVVNKNEKSCAIIDIAIPGDIRVSKKEQKKIEKYQELKRYIKRIWNIRSINVIPGRYYQHSITVENSTARGTARILRKVSDST